MLAIIGATNAGKSLLARDILRRLATILGVASFLEVTVQTDETMDLTDFDVDAHSGVLFDGVGDSLFLWRRREELQGRCKVSKGGRSATMMYAYPITFARRAVIATLDLSAKNLAMFSTDHWLLDDRNVIKLRLDAPAFATV